MGNHEPLRFSYRARHRWAYLPTVAFLLVVELILWLWPSLVWAGGIDPTTRTAGMVLCGVFAVWLGIALLRRWIDPFTIVLEHQAITGIPLLGGSRRVLYQDVVAVQEKPATFFRHAIELELTVQGQHHLLIDGDIQDFERLTKVLRHRLPPAVRNAWTPAPEPAPRSRR